ncbi:MAG: lipoate--protein ligase family protein [Anaerolineae bacterium]|nr:lipoate--protein ligase family protein [Anaerolineae bacterium]
MRQWRLIYDNPANGAWNMAVDEAIMESVGAGNSPPTLRLYAWLPSCLSLGYGQRVADVDFARTDYYGWDVVRRPTGGRAILHADELTYSLSLPVDDDLAAGTVVESYQRISAALVTGLIRLGAAPQADKRAERIESGPVCFETPSHYEITLNERKLIGSAQLRRRGAVLQHGSLPLWGDIARICEGLVFPDDTGRESAIHHVRQRAITLEESLGYAVTWEDAAVALVNGFAHTYAVDFSAYHAALTDDEYNRAVQLMTEVYATSDWTHRR